MSSRSTIIRFALWITLIAALPVAAMGQDAFYTGKTITIIVDGGVSPREIASTIVDLTDEEARWKILREGAISSQEISTFFAKG